ncbi:hypothetical protein QYM36_007168 [Artemia franciscana]|uniref:Uncharacterized protein n=1 Tax=Artemia franciscana TaxID=6661 RepID=A0AA88I2E7_ARTSF|nr:hypothetical protein QYM36_007168 [Artemia franciscana]
MVELLSSVKSLYQEALEHEQESGNDSGDRESIYSFQGYDTECARTDLDGSSDNFEGIEYEPVDDLSLDSHSSDTLSDFDVETQSIRDGISGASTVFADSESDMESICTGIRATFDNLESCSESETEKRHWVCIKCKRFHSVPMSFCRECFGGKIDCFPKRPKRKKKRLAVKKPYSESTCVTLPIPMTSVDLPLPVPMTSLPSTSQSEDMVDGVFDTVDGSYDVVDGPMPKRPRLDDPCTSTSQDSGIEKSESTSSGKFVFFIIVLTAASVYFRETPLKRSSCQEVRYTIRESMIVCNEIYISLLYVRQ